MKKNCFSNNLRGLRKEKGLSQVSLAEICKVSLKTISHWETGYSEPSIEQIIFIAKFFNVTTDDLLGMQ